MVRMDGVLLGALALTLPLLGVAVVTLALLLRRAATRQQHLEAGLRESNDARRRIAEQLDVWRWRTDAQHRLVEMHAPAGAAHRDWAPAADTAAPLWDHLASDDNAALRGRLERAEPLSDLPVRTRGGAHGHALEGRLRGRPLHDADGRFAGYEGLLREVEPPPAPAPAASAVPAAADAHDTESFSYTVSHDLRAPIRVVEGFTKIVKEDYGRLLDRVGNDHLDRVLGAAARMNNMIDALLSLSKLTSQPLARQTVDLSQLAGFVADDLRREMPERRVRIDIQPGMKAEGDPTLLRVVIENLLGNAWKYTGKCDIAEIRFERDPDGGDSYSVRDNGAGFDMRFADRLFGVFQRLHSANDFPGTGVGLASVRRIVRRHGGDIWGEAEPNRGARFHFTLPPPGAAGGAPLRH